jgi:hypothetical protein
LLDKSGQKNDFFASDVPADACIRRDRVAAIRCGTGPLPVDTSRLIPTNSQIGRKTASDVEAAQPLLPELVQSGMLLG